MPYPKDEPKCKHKLISHQGLSVSRLEPKRKPIDLVKMAKSNHISHFPKHIADIYTYKEAPTDPVPLGSFHLYGFCDSSSIPISSSFQGDPTMEGTMTCRIGVKNAAGTYKLDAASIQNSKNFAVLIRQLRKEDQSVFFACTKTQRGGFIVPMEDDESHDASLDFCAYFFVASLDEFHSILGDDNIGDDADNNHHRKTRHEEMQQNTVSSMEVTSLWTPGDTQPQSMGIEEESWTLHEPMQRQNVSIDHMENDMHMEVDTHDSTFHTDEGAAAADAFYSSLKRSLNTRADSILYHMRNYNGWVKATQIAELDPYTIDRSSGNKANDKKRKRKGESLRVLDLACGKGGDLGKWILHKRGIANYVGIDVARGSLVDAALRARNMKQFEGRGCIFTCADLGSDVPGRPKSSKSKKMQKLCSWSLKDDNGIGNPEFHMVRGGGIGMEDTFNVVSIQFAIHYMMSSLKRARRFFHTVSQLLDIGGNLICTTIDSRVVMELMMNTGYDFHFRDEPSQNEKDDKPLIISVGKGACQLKFRREIVKRIFRSSIVNGGEEQSYLHSDNFGLEYTFTLTEGEDHASGVGQVVDLPEWLTPIPVLERLAEEAGLVLEYASNFHEFFDLRKDPMAHYAAHSALYNMNVLNRNGSISEQEWDISRMYVAIKFRKEHEPSFVLEDSDDDESDNDSVEVAGVQSSNPTLKDESMNDNVKTNDVLKELPRAMMIAKQKCGDDWQDMSNEQRKSKINEELSKLTSQQHEE
jgi:SAM-dependent methyltransferase